MAAAALLGIGGAALIWLSTRRYGAGLSPDSGGYLSAARSLLAGDGYLCWNGQVYTQWPPLFPTLLAGAGLFGLDLAVAARILNAVAFGLIVFLSGRLLTRSTTTRKFALIGTLFILVSIPLLRVSVMVWSEPVFIVLVLLFLLHLPSFLHTGRLRSLVLVSILAALACLQRYAGVTTILTGAILIVLSMPGFSLRRRLAYGAGFGVLSGAPLALWFLRNRIVAGQTTGNHHFHLVTIEEIRQALMPAGRVLSTWLFSESFSRTARWLAPVVLAGMVVLTVVSWRRRSSDERDTKRLEIRCAAVYGLVYFAFLVLSGAGLSWAPAQRHLAPMYVSFMLLIVVAWEDGCKSLGKFLRSMPAAETLGILLCLVWLGWRLPLVQRTVVTCLRDGTGGYCSATWQESPLMTRLRQHPPQGRVYSNVPEAIYLLTGTMAESTPYGNMDAAEFAKRMSRQDSYIAWFHQEYGDQLFDLPELLSRYEVEEIADFPDGKLYRTRGVVRPQPWLGAVYRLWLPALRLHYYADRQQRDRLLSGTAGWISECTAFYAFAAGQPGTYPVYHLWSEDRRAHFYTMDEAEKDTLLHATSDTWALPDIAFYAYREASGKGLSPVYRLRSRKSGDCFLTTDARERARLLDESSSAWSDEGVAWYTYGP